MSGEREEYPLSDGELSFSRWRSSGTAQPRVEPHVAQPDEPVLDFQSQFANSPQSVSDASIPCLANISLTSSPSPSWDPAHTPGLSSPGTNYIVSDREFEEDFGLTSPVSSAHEADLEEVFLDRQRMVSSSSHSFNRFGLDNAAVGHHVADEEEQGSCELDSVERREDDLTSSDTSILVALLRTLIFISIWYIFSIGLTVYNKELLGANRDSPGAMHFPAPFLMNTVHFTLQAIISRLALQFLSCSMQPSTTISWRDYFVRVATALDVDLTNASLVFISISVETMGKSAAPVFLLLFAFAFKLEVPSFKLFGIITIISSGVLLTGLGSQLSTESEEQKYNLLGFILVILAAFMSGFRWTVTQVLLQKKEFGLNNPLAVMSQLAPIMALITAVFSAALKEWHKLIEHQFFDTYNNAIKYMLLLLLGGSLAFFMVLAEFLLISKTSAVTLTVAGVVKEVVTILVAVRFLHDKFTAIKGAGLAVIMIGVCWFNWFKYQKFREGKHQDDTNFEKLPVRYIPLTDISRDNEEMHSY